MSNARQRAAELRPDLDIPWSNRALMVPIFHVAAPLAFSPEVHFESGEAGQAAWQEQVESDAGTMINASHAEEIDAVMMAPIAQSVSPLWQIRYETLVVAKESLRHLPHVMGLAGYIVRHGGTVDVERVYEYPNETPEEKADRQGRNLQRRDIKVTVMRAGGNVVTYIEGGSARREKLADGTFKKIPRKKDEMLPAQAGFAHDINETPEPARDKIRMMTVVSRYSGEGRFRLFSPTVVILDPVKPVDGTVEEIRQQGEDEMARGFELVKELDEQR
jgi:hypothetical protein